MLHSSRGITLGINVNGKPHNLAVAPEHLHFKSNWHDSGLEEAPETVKHAADSPA